MFSDRYWRSLASSNSTTGGTISQIIMVWDHLQIDMDSFFPFFKAFYKVRPTETLVLLKGLIDQRSEQSLDIRSISFKKTDSKKSINDDIINILCGFKNHLQLPEAIELLLLYFQKRPDLFEQVYSAFVSQFGVDKDSPRFDYYTQINVVEQLRAAIKSKQSDNILILFVRVAEQYLKLSYSRAEGGRQHTFTFYTIPLTLQESVLKYRKNLLEQLYEIYKDGKCHEEIESLLMDYCREYGDEVDDEIVRRELNDVICFFSLLSSDNLYHCVIVGQIRNVARRVEYDIGDTFASFLQSGKYKIYHVLNGERREMLHLEYKEYEMWHRKQIQELVQHYDLPQYKYLFQICKECLEMVNHKGWRMFSSLEYAIGLASANQTQYINVIQAYIDADTPYNINAHGILTNLFSMMTATEVKLLIDSHNFSQKNTWLWAFYAGFPNNQITVDWSKALLLYLDNIPVHIRSSPYRPIDVIEKYKGVDKDIVIKASRIIVSHYEKSPFVFHLYFAPMMNPHHVDATKIIFEYENDILLLENIYLKCATYSHHDDCEGQFLAEIVRKDPAFFFCYLDKIPEINLDLHRSYEDWTNRLEFIWKEYTFMLFMEQISEYIFTNSQGNQMMSSSIIGHLLLHDEREEDVAEKQERWIQHTIEEYYLDQQRMYGLFHAIKDHSAGRRRRALEKFLSLNRDYTSFEQLPLETSSCGGSGSMIPDMQERITYLSSLLPMLSGIEYLRHKRKIECDIKTWKDNIKREEIDELLQAMG